MKSATEIIGDGCARCTGWTWTCLPCDSTWIGTGADHRCEWRAEWRRTYWIRRLRWALREKLDPMTIVDAALDASMLSESTTIVDKPISRPRMVELLGDRWLVSNDAGANSADALPVPRPPIRPIRPARPFTPSTWSPERATDMRGWIAAHRHIYTEQQLRQQEGWLSKADSERGEP